MATITTTTTSTKELTAEETDTTNSTTLSTMAASLALNNRVYSLDDFDTVATVGELYFDLIYTEVTPGNFSHLLHWRAETPCSAISFNDDDAE